MALVSGEKSTLCKAKQRVTARELTTVGTPQPHFFTLEIKLRDHYFKNILDI
jgi:hypothetical protein